MPRTRKASANTLRIIGGRWRGRKLGFAGIDGLRPSGDRIRETLFNWLNADIRGARCLDLFAGAGGLGLEALSRGAAEVLMIDRHPEAAAQLRRHLQTLGGEGGRVVQADAPGWLRRYRRDRDGAYDIVFIDPPFAANLWGDVIAGLHSARLLAAGAAVYIESAADTQLLTPPDWHLYRQKSAGNVQFRLYYQQKDE